MSRRIRQHIRGNVVGYVALFLVLTGGTAQALQGSNTVFSDDIVSRQVKTADVDLRAITANRIAPNSVGSGRVVDNSLSGADIANLTGADVADGTLTGNDIQPGSVFGGNIADDTVAAPDLAGRAVRSHHLGTMTRVVSNVMVPGGTGENGAYNTREASVGCPSGELALNGEASWTGQANEELFISEFIYTHGATGQPDGLHVTGGNDSGANRQLNVAVHCLAP